MKPKVLQLLEAAAKGEEMASNVTVNGEPLQAFIDAEKRREIEESKPNIKLNRQIVSKHSGNHSRARTSPGEVIWTKGQKATHVIVSGQEFEWMVKSPYPPSGVSVLGAVEYCKPSDEVKCHECGWWGKGLGLHVFQSHNMPVKRYKLKHGLAVHRGISPSSIAKKQRSGLTNHVIPRTTNNWTPVMVETAAKNRAATIHAKKEYASLSGRASVTSAETLNLRSNCQAQRIAQIIELSSRLGRTPTKIELRSFQNSSGYKSLDPKALVKLFGVPMKQILLRAGCVPRKGGTAGTLKTHCKRGHEFNSINTAIWAGVRQCRICTRERQRASKEISHVA